LPSCLGQVTAK